MARLILADGSVWEGESFGAETDADGEVVFNTGMVGYPESLTDPSYRGQILVFTYPLIGNYGVPSADLNEWGFSKNFESEEIQIRGLIVATNSEDFSHQAAVSSLGNWMKHHNIPGITGIDTRALTKLLREHGVMLGRISQDDSKDGKDLKDLKDPNENNLVAEVSCKEVQIYEPNSNDLNEIPMTKSQSPTPNPQPLTVIAYDCGMKRNILRSLLKRGLKVVRVPWDFDITTYDGKIDGVFCSNGPGDPKACVPTINALKWAVEKNIVTFGICLGNQLLALAAGGDTYKLPYGHRGANQPCTEEGTERCIITSQNHGFAADEKLPKGWNVWFRNANDGTVEGVKHESGRFFSVQFHPEATPGPEDANYLFDVFVDAMRGVK